MTDFVKKKIVEKLAKFTKDLKPSDLSFGFLTGKGELRDLELNCDFIMDALQLPPWVRINRVKCDTIRARVPFTNLSNEPIQFVIGTVTIDVSTATDETAHKKHGGTLGQLGSNSPSKYGYTKKVIDGMKIEIRSIMVSLQDTSFSAFVHITDIVIQSTTPAWQPASLPHTRYKDKEEESVVIFKMCVIGSLKIEGWSTVGGSGGGEGGGSASDESVGGMTSDGGGGGSGDSAKRSLNVNAKLRLIAGETRIQVALKRLIEDCSVLHTRVVVQLDDVMWIISQAQLRAVSRLVQTLMAAAVATAQHEREERERLIEAAEMESFSGESTVSEGGEGKSSRKREKKARAKQKGGLSQREVNLKKRIYEYRSGKKNMPSHEIVQNSFHLMTGSINFQFCDDTTTQASFLQDGGGRGGRGREGREGSGGESRPSSHSTVEGSMLVRLRELQVDVYLDQPAGQGKCHWNRANDLILRNTRWSEELIKQASKSQHLDLPSVSPPYLHERGIVIRCADFTVDSLRSNTSMESELPLIASDKKTFNIPEDVHNPAFQVGLTIYFYPDIQASKSLIPRPNVYIYVSPVHMTLHQLSCLWIIEFIHGVLATINKELALSVQMEGKAFLEERKAQAIPKYQLPGVDVDFKILFTKITIPIPETFNDSRPRALQLETGSISLQNDSLDILLQNSDFRSALSGMERGWVFAMHGTNEFPHFCGDLPPLASWLKELLAYELHDSRLGLVAEIPSSPREVGGATSPIGVHTEAWHLSTDCVHVSFTKSDRHEDILRPKDFVNDFPLHLWLFLPRKKTDESVGHWAAEAHTFAPSAPPPPPPFPSSSPSSSSPSATSSASCSNLPTISFLAHISEPIHAELERLQLLFLLRLKDSFASFKMAIMKFLTIPAPETVAKEMSSPQNFSCHGEVFSGDRGGRGRGVKSEGGDGVRGEVEEGGRGVGKSGGRQKGRGGTCVGEETATPTQKEGSGEADTADRLPTQGSHTLHHSADEEAPNKTTSSPTIGGCVVVHSVQVDLLLPSLFSFKPSHSTNTEVNTPLTCPSSPSPSPAPPLLTPTAGGVETERSGVNSTESGHVSVGSMESEHISSGVKFPLHRTNTASSLHYVSSTKREKLPPLVRVEPQYVLRISMKRIAALPNIQANEISLRASIGHVGLEEIKSTERTPQERRRGKEEEEDGGRDAPVIKARIEIGSQVKRFGLPAATVSEKEQDTVVMVMVAGLDTALLLKNATVLKDFFNDEYEVDTPVPIQVRVVDTSLLLRESLDHTADTDSSLNVHIASADIHRGKKIRGINLFRMLEEATTETETLGVNAETPSHAMSLTLRGSEDDSRTSVASTNSELLCTFCSFIDAFESHMSRHGGLNAQLHQPEHIAGLLQELQVSLSDEDTDRERGDGNEAPRVDSDNSPPENSPTLLSRLAELKKLRLENKELRRIESENRDLISQLTQAKVLLAERSQDLDSVTSECKKTKDELVPHKQVLENYQEHIEKLLSENADLRSHISDSAH